MKKILNFKDQIVVVTGASSGIGYATALAFAKHGATVALVARNQDKLVRVANEIAQTGGHSIVIPTDVSSIEQVSQMAQRLVDDFGRVDVLINNAGSSTVGSIEHSDFVDNTKKMMAVDFFGAVNCTQALLPLMRKQGTGHIVNMSSVVGRKAFPKFVGYSACMHAVTAFSDGLRQELHGSGISVSTIHPALTQTPLLEQVDPADMPAPFRHMTPITVESVARAILAAVLKKRTRVVVPWQPRVLMLLEALSPHYADGMVRLLSKPWFIFLLGMNKGRRYRHTTSIEAEVISNL